MIHTLKLKLNRRHFLLSTAAIAVARPAFAQEAATPKTGGTLIYLERQPHTNLYPPAGGFYPNSGILNQITDKLLWQNPETLELEPWLAESWEVNADATEFTFKLFDGITFSDGTPLDAAAVALNFDTFGLGNPEKRYPVSEVLANYVSSEVIDPLTVKFTFSQPSPGFLQGTSVIGSGIVSPQTLDHPFDDLGDATKIIGSGPFVISGEVLGKEVDFTARPDYNWAPASWGHTGAAYLDGIKMLIAPEDSVRIGALISGQADIIRQVQSYDEPQVEAVGAIIYAAPTNGVNNTLVFRPENPLVADAKVRQALIHATNTQEIVDTIFSPNYPQATSILAKGAMGYVNLSDKLAYDPALAAQLLDEAGWTLGSDGLREKDGVKLAVACYEALAQPQSRAVLQLIAQQWGAVGVTLQVLPMDSSSAALNVLDPALAPVLNSMVGRADLDVMRSFFSPQARNNMLQVGGLGQGKSFVDETMNDLLESIATAADPAQRAALGAEAQNYVIDNGYVVPLFEEPQVFGAQAYVKGLAFDSVARPSFFNVWLDK
ncbi:ABC transporter periplasmic protein [Ketogulonicigenium robustum]|uniref:ABC transporter periplasmic protein n=1 Tax=Ketogulonicigenium robustum TaxID=92947 RepID=A0A1W6NYQ3_9RHOB|nr:TIGR04028 family ABC transporter substrate-binding protein [Ketogulonicigenium robustum]ARO14375.1 ABC transporter periplasmic protein [Ketogulonicigenium robustum]